jgi:hypothetical protein
MSNQNLTEQLEAATQQFKANSHQLFTNNDLWVDG